MPVYEPEGFHFLAFIVNDQLPFIKVKSNVAEAHGDFFHWLYPVIDGNDLMVRIEGRHLEIICGIKVLANLYLKVHLFQELSSQTFAGALSEFEAATRKFGIIVSADVFVAYQ